MSYLKPFIKALIQASLAAMVVTTIIGGALYTRVEGTEIDLDKLKIEPTPTVIYDKDGDVVAKFKEEKKDVTAYEEIPIELIQAVVSTEDRAFYDHAGINVKAIFRAGTAVLQAGDLVQGGSTITQQLIKQVYLTSEKSLDRKIKEAMYATELESEISKNEIIKSYLNHVYYGNGAYGVRSAIKTYYGMSLEEFKALDKEERVAKAALLGGIVQLPSANDPYINPEGSLKRTKVVLQNMKTVGYISNAEYEDAMKQGLSILEKPQRDYDDQIINNAEITTYALKEAAEKLDITEQEVRFGGYEIYTSFDPEAYKIVRKKVEDDSLHPTSTSETSVSIINPKNGEIIALTGGRTAPKYTEYNRAYQGKKQPGSSMKPIIVYAPALESGKFTPWSALTNQPGTTFALGYTPKNSDGKGSSKITMIEAIQRSQNIAAVYTLDKVGITYATKFAEKLGIEFSDADRYLPIALGGLSEGLNTLQLADAYQGFANGGHRIKAHMIKRIVDNDGEIVHEVNTELNEKNRVMKETTANYMENMLQNAVINGTGQNAKIEGELVGGKTGTTDSQNNIWFSGFTSEFVMAVWMGYDQEKALPVTSYVAAKMFGEIGKGLAKIYPDGDREYEPLKQEEKGMKSINVAVDLDEKNKKVTLSWKKEKETEYSVFRDGKEIKSGLTKGEFTDSRLEVGKSYGYQIVGYNKYTDIETHKSNNIDVIIEEKDKSPEAPQFKNSSSTEDSVSIEWSEVDGASKYILTRNGIEVFTGLKTEFVDEGLTPSTAYHYQLVAINKAGKSKVAKINVTTKEDKKRVLEEDEEEVVKEEPTTTTPAQTTPNTTKPETTTPTQTTPNTETNQTKPETTTPAQTTPNTNTNTETNTTTPTTPAQTTPNNTNTTETDTTVE